MSNNKQSKSLKFNPIKEDESGKKAKRMIWSTAVVNAALSGLELGKRLVANPFYENNTKLLKADLVYERTDEEKEDWKRCKSDIIHFAKKCKLMTPEGIQYIELRPYQKNYLKHLVDNRLSIYLSCRQSGKCLTFLTEIQCVIKNGFDSKLKLNKLQNYYIKDNEYKLPLFELYNLFDDSILWKIEYRLYKILYRLCNGKIKKRV